MKLGINLMSSIEFFYVFETVSTLSCCFGPRCDFIVRYSAARMFLMVFSGYYPSLRCASNTNAANQYFSTSGGGGGGGGGR